MIQVDKIWLISLLVVVVVLLTMSEQVTSRSTHRDFTLLRHYCSATKGRSPEYFKSNLNATLSSLRRQLNTSAFAVVARTFFNAQSESVWGNAWCRRDLSISDCLDCIDYVADELKVCELGNGGSIIYSDCELRYEYINFTEANNRNGVVLCSNITSPQSIEFQKEAEKLISDIQIAAPRTMDFYAASTRNVDVDNTTVYAIAQCNLNISQSVCLECLKLKSQTMYDCLPIMSGWAMDNGCFMRYDWIPFFGQNQTTDITSLLWDGNSSKKRYIIGVCVGGVSLLLLALFLWSRRYKNRVRGQQVSVNGTVNYNYKHLQLATNNFSEMNIIGKGGFGEVFKAILGDMKIVAVKKLKVGYVGAKVGFENEILLISHIRHRNLLQLLGWCSEGHNLLLVLEYMPNGSLDKFLWGEKKGTLDWKRRYDIILGIARGLAHLHKEFHVRIVHRDIKSSNILLDDALQPKIADFGLAKFHPENQSHVTTKFAGTLGYTAPEYILYGHLSDKVDTFSFGIVILEIISGRKCTYRIFDGTSTDCLLEYAWKLYETKNLRKLVDETMDVNQHEEEHAMNIIEIALLCTQTPVSKRPTMDEVVLKLQNDPSMEKKQLARPNFINQNWRIQTNS